MRRLICFQLLFLVVISSVSAQKKVELYQLFYDAIESPDSIVRISDYQIYTNQDDNVSLGDHLKKRFKGTEYYNVDSAGHFVIDKEIEFEDIAVVPKGVIYAGRRVKYTYGRVPLIFDDICFNKGINMMKMSDSCGFKMPEVEINFLNCFIENLWIDNLKIHGLVFIDSKIKSLGVDNIDISRLNFERCEIFSFTFFFIDNLSVNTVKDLSIIKSAIYGDITLGYNTCGVYDYDIAINTLNLIENRIYSRVEVNGINSLEYLGMQNCILYPVNRDKSIVELTSNFMEEYTQVPKKGALFRTSEDYQMKNANVKKPYGHSPLLETRLFINVLDETFDLDISNCTFLSDSVPQYDIIRCNLNELRLRDNTFESTLNLSDSKIENKIDISHNSFNTYLGISQATLPSDLKLDWQQLSGHRLALLNTGQMSANVNGFLISYPFSTVYLGKNDEELANSEMYEELIATYQRLYTNYKARGDMESANGCYAEMKDIQSNRLKYVYQNESTFRNYFAWRLSQLLKVYTRHGTDPAQAVVASFWVLLFFAVFYFFFPSDWDVFDRKSFFERLKKLILYFESDESINAIKPFSSVELQQEYLDFEQFMRSKKENIPFLIYQLTKPFYQIQLFFISRHIKLMQYFDYVKGKYSDLNYKRRFFVNILGGVMFALYLLFSILVRALNALTLSINSFITLGFGNIPTKGIAKYIVIVQGFIGWLLLSLFSVSLINQVLG